jgi:hypothetical protein
MAHTHNADAYNKKMMNTDKTNGSSVMREKNISKNGKVAGGAAAGSVFTGFLAASCCIGPPLFALAGISGMGLIATVMPYRTEIFAASVLLLSIGFYFAYRKPGGAGACETPAGRKINRAFVWIAAGLVLFFAASPYLRILFS